LRPPEPFFFFGYHVVADAILPLARFRKLPVKRRVGSACLLALCIKIRLTLAEVLVDVVPIRYIESQNAEDLLKAEGGKGFRDPLGRLSSEKRRDYRVQRNACVFDEVSAIALLDVFPDHMVTDFSIREGQNT
jgi:hypothetical protein